MKQFIIILLLSTTTNAQYFDPSNISTKHEILKDILFKADSVIYAGDTIIHVFENEISMNRFRIYATSEVQTVCYVTHGDYDTTKVIFELQIGKDSNFISHNNLIDTIYNFWKAQDKDFWNGGYKALPVPVGLFYSKKKYVLYLNNLDNINDSYYYIWFNNRIMKIFQIYVFKGGLGAGSFMNQNLIFKFSNTEVIPNYKSDFSPYKFRKLYGNGFFKRN